MEIQFFILSSIYAAVSKLLSFRTVFTKSSLMKNLNVTLLVAALLTFSGTSCSLLAQDSTTLETTKDAYVRPGSGNKGTASNLSVKFKGEGNTSTRLSWIGFDISSLSQPVAQAELYVYLARVSGSDTAHAVYGGANGWEERQIVYGNQPSILTDALDMKALQSGDENSWIAYDVTAFINQQILANENEASLVIESADRIYTHYDSREGGNPPALEITFGDSPAGPDPDPGTGQGTLLATDDTMVRGGSANANSSFGSSGNIDVKTSGNDAYTRRAFFKFDMSDVSYNVNQATFRVYMQQCNGTCTHNLFSTDENWQESTLTFNSSDLLDQGAFLDGVNLTDSDDGLWVEFDVTDHVAEAVGDDSVAFTIENSNGVFSRYRSKEFDVAFAPQLVLNGGGDGNVGNSIEVDDVQSLRAALSAASAGDVILLAPGTYAPGNSTQGDSYGGKNRDAYFMGNADGTENAPIVVKAKDPNNPPILQGARTSDSTYILWIRGDYWMLQDLVLEKGGKGLILDDSSHSVVSNVSVENIGQEGIHLRSGTSDTLIDRCETTDTGVASAGIGEGIYVGSDGKHWPGNAEFFDEKCYGNIIRRCIIKRCRAEGIDIKEGTRGTIVEDCEIHGDLISGENHADSFIDLKGNTARVHGNVFHQGNNAKVTRGVAVVYRVTDPSTTANENWIYDNDFDMDFSSGYMVHAYRGQDNRAWDNRRSRSGQEYSGGAPELYIGQP